MSGLFRNDLLLKSWTLANYRDKFEWLLDSLGSEYVKHIKVRENDEQPVGILDVIQILSAVNPVLFNDEKPATDSYRSVGKCLEWFVDEEDKYGFRKFQPIAKDVVRLYDYVRYHWKEKYNAVDDGGKPGRWVQERKRKDGSAKRDAFPLTIFSNPLKGQSREMRQSKKVWRCL